MILIIVFAVCYMFLVIAANYREKNKQEYDERQILIQYKGYKASAFTAIILSLSFAVAFFFYPGLPFDTPLVLMVIAFMTALVFAIYNIVKGDYFGIGGKWKSWTIMSAVISALNLYSGILHIQQSGLMQDGKITLTGTVNLLLGIFFAVVVIAVLTEHIRERNE